jgi:hypothetical protein
MQIRQHQVCVSPSGTGSPALPAPLGFIKRPVRELIIVIVQAAPSELLSTSIARCLCSAPLFLETVFTSTNKTKLFVDFLCHGHECACGRIEISTHKIKLISKY